VEQTNNLGEKALAVLDNYFSKDVSAMPIPGATFAR
jgi:hypothetical protein